MEKYTINSEIFVYELNELALAERTLIEAAKEATEHSYAPYSHFHVGAALLLQNGTILTGSNQENASYPLSLCAERTAIFHAQHSYPQQPIVAIAIAAKNENGFMNTPTPPCGACRQVMLEVEDRYNVEMRILLYSSNGIHVINSTKDLLPLQFIGESMK